MNWLLRLFRKASPEEMRRQAIEWAIASNERGRGVCWIIDDAETLLSFWKGEE